MSVQVVIGLGLGDEGKGVVTDYLCSQDPDNTKVVRFSGGHQCGHKVIRGDVEHIFSNFGSGTLSGCPTYWSRYCTFEPVGFWREYSLLREKGITPKITIHPECPVTTVYDIFANRQSAEVKHGTTGTGFFRTKKRHLKDGVKFSVRDCLLGPPNPVLEKLDSIRAYYSIQGELDLSLFLEACSNVRQLVRDGAVFINGHLTQDPHLVFEGSQGLLLDEHIGDFPHVTPSDITPRNALRMVKKIDEIYLVSRVYQTRHGNGPMTNVEHPISLVNTEKETNELNKYQGEFRVSILDLDRLIRAKTEGIDKVVQPSTHINLVMTCADQLSSYRVSSSGEIMSFDDVGKFVNFIGNSLKINGDLYINTSPYSTTVEKEK